MVCTFGNSLFVWFLLAIPSDVTWSYLALGIIFAIGLAQIFLRKHWQNARGLEKLILFGPMFYAGPLAAFGVEHFTQTPIVASLVPSWIPWPLFWAYFIGVCFIAAALSIVSQVQSRLSASLLALTFLIFVLTMDVPGWLHNIHDRFAITLVLRELAFSGGALALATTLGGPLPGRSKPFATIARYFIAVPTLFYSLQQFLHGDHVPGVPLEPLTPQYVWGHGLWTYFAAVMYAITGLLLLFGKNTRAAAAGLGATVLLVELAVYVPIAWVERASLGNGLNYFADTLMFCGAILLLAGAMPRATAERAKDLVP